MKINRRSIIIVGMVLFGPLGVFAPNMWPSYSYDEIQKDLRKQFLQDQEYIYRENLKQFKAEIAMRESSNNWKEYNPYGYIGKFQFGQAALEMTGFGHVSFVDFMNNPAVFPESDQETAMDSLLRYHEHLLRPYIEKFVGQYLQDSVKITRSGLLAAAHLAGPNNVKRFLKSNGKHNPSDQMGTHLSDYLTTFAANFH